MPSFLFKTLPVALVVGAAAVLGPLMSSLTLTGSSYHDDQRALEALVLLFGALAAVFRCWQHGPSMLALLDKPSAGLVGLFFILGLLSSVLAYSSRHALYEWASFGLLLLLAWLIAAEAKLALDRCLNAVLLLAGLGCAMYVFKVFLTYVWTLQSGIQPDPADFIIGFSNYRFFNHVQTISLPLLGLLVLRTRQKGTASARQAIGWWVLLSLWWMLLFVSVGRGTFVGLLAGIVMALFWRRQQALAWCRVMLLSALAGLAAYAVFFVWVPTLIGLQPFGFLSDVVQRSVANPDSSRWFLWQRAGEMIIAHPWLGAGPLHFAHEGRDINNGAHPHNWMLQIACEWGVPALLCLSAVILMGFRKLLRIGPAIAPDDLQNQAVLTVWLVTGVAIVVDGLVSGLIVMPSSQLWIVLYIGCAWGWANAFSKPEKTAKLRIPRTTRLGLSIMLLAMLFFLGKGLWPEIMNLSERENLQLELHPQIRLSPRIWSMGYF